MNVAIFTDNDFQKVNGVTTSLRAVLAHVPSDMRVRIYTCDAHGEDRPDYLALKARGIGIPFYSEMKMYLPPVGRLLRQAVADRMDVIHLTTPGPMGLAAMRVASRLHLPMVGSFHTHLAEYTARLSGSARLGALMQEYMRWPYGRCARVLAPSESTRAVLVAGKIRSDRIGIWRRGVSTSRFDPARRSAALRRSWGVTDGEPVVLYVGRLSREKGLADFAVLQRQFGAHGVPHRLVFVGDGPMRDELARLCTGAVFTGALDHDQVAVAMASSDLFVFPSRTDTAGNVVLEAQASGLPVLVTDEGGPRENMVDGDTGFVCGSVREMGRRARELAVNPERRARVGRAAREYARNRTWDAALAPLYQAYRDVMVSPAMAAGITPDIVVA